MKVRLLEKYQRDIEWWVAYPADPRFAYYEPGEELEVGDEEAQAMLKDGIAEAAE